MSSLALTALIIGPAALAILGLFAWWVIGIVKSDGLGPFRISEAFGFLFHDPQLDNLRNQSEFATRHADFTADWDIELSPDEYEVRK